MFTPRQLSETLRQHLDWYPIIYLGGPRQSGKTTLLRQLFPDLPYSSLEDLDARRLAEDDPRRFLGAFPDGAILDEAQRVPSLFSYLQTRVDGDPSQRFLLSGSQNFLMMEKIGQSLAGRVGILNLLPFSLSEIEFSSPKRPELEDFCWRGGYPALFDRGIPQTVFFSNYVQTYLERDVRLLKNVGDLSLFARFLRLCAGRIGQPLNLANLAADTGLAVNTVKSWISVLEASYLIFLLPPHHENFNKRLTKTPKLYFFDTGLACHLLGISASEQLETHHYFGNLAENALISELWKKRTQRGERPQFYFWQDRHGTEIDLIVEENGSQKAIEFKTARTFHPRLLSGLEKWQKLSGAGADRLFLVYAGEQEIDRASGKILPWATAMERL